MVLGHSVWSKGLPAFIITLIGWVTLVLDFSVIFAPSRLGVSFSSSVFA
jgi:hypothetical protein